MNTLFALTRTVHFGACLLLLGVPLFDRLMIAPLPAAMRDATDQSWKPIATVLTLLAVVLSLISGAAWLGFVSIEMSGLPPREALAGQTLNVVWSQTQFGRLWQLRTMFWLVASALTIWRVSPIATFSRSRQAVSAPRRRNIARATVLFFAVLAGTCFVGSLSWAGHGQTGPHAAFHLLADMIHLLIGAVWPVGLLPFALTLLRLRRSEDLFAGEVIAAITRRFSAASLVSVALLALSGTINSWSLVGPVVNLWKSDYGRLLSLKIILFAAMFVIGSRNLLHWKPLLAIDGIAGRRENAAGKLQRNLLMELSLCMIVILIVGYLGLMMPPFHEHHMHHHSAEMSEPKSH